MPSRAVGAKSNLRTTITRAPSLRAQVYDRLRAAILSGELAPGAAVVEAEIAASLGASRTPVREALMRLETEGLIEPRGMRGSVVRELKTDEIDCVFEIREALETLAARRAARRLTERDASGLQALIDRMRKHLGDPTETARANTEFHDRILAIADGERLKRMLGDLRADVQPWRALSLGNAERRRESLDEHAEILAAMIAHDEAAAADASRRHIANAKRAVIANGLPG